MQQNIEAQQEEIEEEQQETGKYGDESKLIALIGYVPAFNNYSQTSVPDATTWYSSSDIYTSATLDDNTSAFYGLVNENLKGLSQMIDDQPNIMEIIMDWFQSKTGQLIALATIVIYSCRIWMDRSTVC